MNRRKLFLDNAVICSHGLSVTQHTTGLITSWLSKGQTNRGRELPIATLQTRTKYHLLGLLFALVGLLAVAPSAQGQATPPQCTPSNDFCMNKTVNPNPVQVGQTLTFEIELTEQIGITLVEVTDVLPPSVEFVSVSPPCTLVDNTVECTLILVRSETITIQVIPRECGTFTNTATAATPVQTVSDTEEITVEGCEETPLPTPGQQPPGQQQQEGAPAPITQEGEQESEAGEIDQSFDIS